MKFTITPAQNGFLKGIVLVVLAALASYLADSAHLTGLMNPAIATIVAALASSAESHIRDQTGRGLGGAIGVR